MRKQSLVRFTIFFFVAILFFLVSYFLYLTSHKQVEVGVENTFLNSNGEEEDISRVFKHYSTGFDTYGLKNPAENKNINMSAIYDVTASSEGADGDKVFQAANAIDQDSTTYWLEGGDGYGEGESITFTNKTSDTQTIDFIVMELVEDGDLSLSRPASEIFDVYLVEGNNETELYNLEMDDYEALHWNSYTFLLNEPLELKPGASLKFVISEMNEQDGDTNYNIGISNISFLNGDNPDVYK